MYENFTKLCEAREFQTDGVVSAWGAWNDHPCPVTCGVSARKTKSRTRTCIPPKNGGKECPSLLTETQSQYCGLNGCPVNGGYSQWSEWSLVPCTATCGTNVTSVKTRFRSCTNPAPNHGGRSCSGPSFETLSFTCSLSECPVDGIVSTWSVWSDSPCPVTCSISATRTRSRTRTCTPPQNGGKECPSPLTESQNQYCGLDGCPVHGGYSLWSEWSLVPCTATCGANVTSVKIRFRSCTNPAPNHGGRSCSGPSFETSSFTCSLSECPVDGIVSTWSVWRVSPCPVTCGTSARRTRSRTRTCTPPQNGGKECPSPLTESQSQYCGLDGCPGIQGIAGDVKNIRRLHSGALLIECAKRQQSTNLLNTKTFAGISVTVPAHKTLNRVVRDRERLLAVMSELDIVSEMKDQEQMALNRIKFTQNVSFADAKKLVQSSEQAQSYASIARTSAATSAVTKLSVSCQTNLTWMPADTQLISPAISTQTAESLPSTSRIQSQASSDHEPSSQLTVKSQQIVNTKGKKPDSSKKLSGSNPKGTENKIQLFNNYGSLEDVDVSENARSRTHIHGGYSLWSKWSLVPCRATCGANVTSVKTRFRSCTNPVPNHGGRSCSGPSFETNSFTCGLNACPVDAVLSQWTSWSNPACPASCGASATKMRVRRRTCTPPQNGGKSCTVNLTEELHVYCGLNDCPVDGGYSPWSGWSLFPCTATCGENVTSVRVRSRSCSNPVPNHGGSACQGSTFETEHVPCETDRSSDYHSLHVSESVDLYQSQLRGLNTITTPPLSEILYIYHSS
ncbi:A disintegrin and metalloproteinase with thrombospondin motifs adt-1-like [Haliotis asinina]|uniref:A disintegrin and metalloproteinase with thrombospondin motifs adt-1-like n=1 Tax=Haliotis asinina TaxID=109174 RepID=UPI0035320B31